MRRVDVPLLSLWQQIVIFLLFQITNPIFIHSFVVVIRLYWFEKKIQNVNIRSKQQSRIRRSMSLRTTLPDPADLEQGLNKEEHNQHKNSSAPKYLFPRKFTLNRLIDRPHERLPKRMSFKISKSPTLSKGRESSSDSPTEPEKYIRSQAQNFNSPRRVVSNQEADTSKPVAIEDRDIRFADLVAAPRERKNSVKPADMAKSINLMESMSKNSNHESYDASGPALVIKGLRDSSDTESDLENETPREKKPNKRMKSTPDLPKSGSNIRHDDMGPSNHVPLHRFKTSVSPNAKISQMNKRSHTIEQVYHLGETLKRTFSFDRLLSAARKNEKSHVKLQRAMSSNYLSWEPTIGGNSVFVEMSEEQREELGGVEYRSLKLLWKILAAYFVGFQLLAAIMLLAWAVGTKRHDEVYAAAGTNPTWWSIFTAESAFNNVGYSLTADSMISFDTAAFPLIVMSIFIVIGNTGFPCMLYLIIWISHKMVPASGRTQESLGFLLDHPRRCFTMLLPANATWWLLGVLVALNLADLILFLILDLHGEAVADLPYGYRVLAGLFQSVSTRTAGFSDLNLAELHVAVQVSYMLMMYISVYPLAMSIRRTNVYEEQSLGVYRDPEQPDDEAPSYIATHLRRQLSHDLWFIFLGFFIITIAEGPRFKKDPIGFTEFALLFEIVSAYGTVGMSLGYPGVNTSFSGQFSTISKLVMIAILYRGRHRGLPYALDRAIMLPSEKLDQRDYVQEHKVLRAHEHAMSSRRNSASVIHGSKERAAHAAGSLTGFSSSHLPMSPITSRS